MCTIVKLHAAVGSIVKAAVAGDFSQFLMVLGIFAGAVVSGFTGFAFSAVAGAVLLHVLPPREAVPLMMVCSVLVQSMSLFSLRRHIEWRGSLRLILGGLAGLPPPPTTRASVQN